MPWRSLKILLASLTSGMAVTADWGGVPVIVWLNNWVCDSWWGSRHVRSKPEQGIIQIIPTILTRCSLQPVVTPAKICQNTELAVIFGWGDDWLVVTNIWSNIVLLPTKVGACWSQWGQILRFWCVFFFANFLGPEVGQNWPQSGQGRSGPSAVRTQGPRGPDFLDRLSCKASFFSVKF